MTMIKPVKTKIEKQEAQWISNRHRRFEKRIRLCTIIDLTLSGMPLWSKRFKNSKENCEIIKQKIV